MSYIRKTRDYWSVQQYTGRQYNWEEVTAEDTLSEARKRCREYRQNQSDYPCRIKLRRERITLTGVSQ